MLFQSDLAMHVIASNVILIHSDLFFSNLHPRFTSFLGYLVKKQRLGTKKLLDKLHAKSLWNTNTKRIPMSLRYTFFETKFFFKKKFDSIEPEDSFFKRAGGEAVTGLP